MIAFLLPLVAPQPPVLVEIDAVLSEESQHSNPELFYPYSYTNLFEIIVYKVNPSYALNIPKGSSVKSVM